MQDNNLNTFNYNFYLFQFRDEWGKRDVLITIRFGYFQMLWMEGFAFIVTNQIFLNYAK